MYCHLFAAVADWCCARVGGGDGRCQYLLHTIAVHTLIVRVAVVACHIAIVVALVPTATATLWYKRGQCSGASGRSC
jgi:hypothetical protein